MDLNATLNPTNALIARINDVVTRGTAITAKTPHLALLSAITNAATGDVTELNPATYDDYAPVDISGKFGAAPSDGSDQLNTGEIEFPEVGASGWDDIVGVAILDGAEGTVTHVGAFAAAVSFPAKWRARFPIGDLAISTSAPA